MASFNDSSANNSSAVNGTIDHLTAGSEVISGYAYLLCALIGTPANAYVIYQLKSKKLRKTPEVSRLLINLAVADLMVTLIHCMVEASWTFTNQWLGGDFLCKFFSFFRSFGVQVSARLP